MLIVCLSLVGMLWSLTTRSQLMSSSSSSSYCECHVTWRERLCRSLPADPLLMPACLSRLIACLGVYAHQLRWPRWIINSTWRHCEASTVGHVIVGSVLRMSCRCQSFLLTWRRMRAWCAASTSTCASVYMSKCDLAMLVYTPSFFFWHFLIFLWPGRGSVIWKVDDVMQHPPPSPVLRVGIGESLIVAFTPVLCPCDSSLKLVRFSRVPQALCLRSMRDVLKSGYY